MRPLTLALCFALALAGCGDGDRVDAIQVQSVALRPGHPTPPLSLLRNRDPVALAIRVPRRQLVAEMIDSDEGIRFWTFRCRYPNRMQETEIYGDGVPLWRDWNERPASDATPLPESVEIIVLVSRRAFGPASGDDPGGPVCGRFAKTRPALFGILPGLSVDQYLSRPFRLPLLTAS